MLRERRRERHPRTNHPARPRERRLHRGPQPAVVLRTGEGEGRGRGRGRGRGAGVQGAENGEKRATTRKTETAKGFGSAGSRARRRTKATEATGQGARSTSARVGHHANVERGARREQDTSCARGGIRDAGRRSAPSQFEQQRLLCVGPFRGSGPSRNTRKRETGWRVKSTHPRKAAAPRRMEPPGARPAT